MSELTAYEKGFIEGCIEQLAIEAGKTFLGIALLVVAWVVVS